jgi:hypothetical protein
MNILSLSDLGTKEIVTLSDFINTRNTDNSKMIILVDVLIPVKAIENSVMTETRQSVIIEDL